MKRVILLIFITLSAVANADSTFEKIPDKYFSYTWNQGQCIPWGKGFNNHSWKHILLQSKDMSLKKILKYNNKYILTEISKNGINYRLYFLSSIAVCSGLNAMYGYRY